MWAVVLLCGSPLICGPEIDGEIALAYAKICGRELNYSMVPLVQRQEIKTEPVKTPAPRIIYEEPVYQQPIYRQPEYRSYSTPFYGGCPSCRR